MNSKDIKILIADDEEDILNFVSYNLEKQGFIVYTAHNGEEAIQVAQREKPALILLDIMMPKLDGIAVCQKLRSFPHFDHTMICFLTARGEDFTQVTALEAGGDDFIAKPIRPAILISRIHALLRRNERLEVSSQTQNILHFGKLTINKENISVQLNGKNIPLAKKEFELLVLLASRPDKVFTRDEILHKIWGNDVIVGARTIDVHIRKLRQKLGDHSIRTVKGIGYTFVG